MDFPIPDRRYETPPRPGIVSAIAIYQFLKTLYFVYLFFWVGFRAEIPVFHIGPLSHDVANFVMLVVGVIALALGISALGLWNLQSWARHLMLVPLGGFGYSVGYFYWSDRVEASRLFFQTFFPSMFVTGLVVLDMVSLATLLFYPGIARTFNDEDLEIPGL